MQKIGQIIIFLLISLASFGQKDFVEIKGRVYAFTLFGKDTLLLKNADVFLKINDSILLKQTTSEDGKYNFVLGTSNSSAVLYSEATNQTFNKIKKQYCFFADSEQRKIDLSKKKIFIADFKFTQYTDCHTWLPEIFFAKNEVSPINIDTLSYLISLLRDFPLMTIQINGYADDQEANPADLSARRAEFIIQELVKKGISENRMTSKGFGSSQPIISKDIIRKARTKNEKVLLRQKNGRVTFQITKFEIE